MAIIKRKGDPWSVSFEFTYRGPAQKLMVWITLRNSFTGLRGFSDVNFPHKSTRHYATILDVPRSDFDRTMRRTISYSSFPNMPDEGTVDVHFAIGPPLNKREGFNGWYKRVRGGEPYGDDWDRNVYNYTAQKSTRLSVRPEQDWG